MAEGEKKSILEVIGLAPLLDAMEPGQKKVAAIVLGVILVVVFMALIVDDENDKKTKYVKPTVKSLISNVNTRELGMDSLGVHVKNLKTTVGELTKKNEILARELEDIRKRRGNDPGVTSDISKLTTQMNTMQKNLQQHGWTLEDIKEGEIDISGGKSHTSDTYEVLPETDNGLIEDPNYYFRAETEYETEVAPLAAAPTGEQGALEDGGLAIFEDVSEEVTVSDDDREDEVYMPAGSILSGVMLNGLDAPTGQNARKDPFPVLVRIQHDAILPNEYLTDVKECFATISGYGDLSTERAMLRGETFSCVNKDKEFIEVDFPSYAVGDDGKAGVRGRLVDKAWPLIKNTSIAGFFSGAAKAFNTTPVPVIQTGNVGSNRVFQDNLGSDVARHGVSEGASTAFAKIADIYADIADEIFPVVEVDAFRKVDLVVTKGFYLKIKKRGKRKGNAS